MWLIRILCGGRPFIVLAHTNTSDAIMIGGVGKVGVASLSRKDRYPNSPETWHHTTLLPSSASSIAVPTAIRPFLRDASLSAGSGTVGSKSLAMDSGEMYFLLDQSSSYSAHAAPAKRSMDPALGKTWTTRDLHFISLFMRSCTLLSRMRPRCPAGKSG